jgi:cyanophycinase-like exopeptidase
MFHVEHSVKHNRKQRWRPLDAKLAIVVVGGSTRKIGETCVFATLWRHQRGTFAHEVVSPVSSAVQTNMVREA